MLKKLVLASVITIPALASSAYAANSHFGMALGYNSLAQTEVGLRNDQLAKLVDYSTETKKRIAVKSITSKPFMVGLSYTDDMFEAGLAANYTYQPVTEAKAKNYHLVPIAANIGLRNHIVQNLYVTYGVNGAVRVMIATGAEDKKDNGFQQADSSYSVGAYVGLNYQLSQHLLLSATVNPYTYTDFMNEKKDAKIVNTMGPQHQVFSQGSISLTYLL